MAHQEAIGGGNWASPPGDTSNYFTVGPSTSDPGTVVLNSLSKYFGYYGGSPDTYNPVELLIGTTLLVTFSGTFLATVAGLAPNGDQSKAAYWNILASKSSEYFNTVKFHSTTIAFETDKHASVSTVPLPAAWFFGTGL